MRYITTERVTFVNAENEEREMILPQEALNVFDLVYRKTINIGIGEDLDEISQRDGIFGMDGETLYFHLLDFNAVAIVDNDFSTDNLKTLRIPRQV